MFRIFRVAAILIFTIPACLSPDEQRQPVDSSGIDSIVQSDQLDTIFKYTPYGTVNIELRRNDTVIENMVFESTSDTFYYPNGKVRHVVVGPSADFDAKHYYYYMNGQLESVHQQGMVFGCGIAVGEELYYDSIGNLLSKTEYDNYLPDSASGCHDTRTIMTVTEYYSNKKTRLVKQMTTAYEAGIDCPCGTWEYYDSSGTLIRKEKYPACKGHDLDCDAEQ